MKNLPPRKSQPAKSELPGVAERIRYLRKKSGLTLEDYGKKLGINKSTASQWETGVALPGLVNVARVAELFSVSIEWLVRGDGYSLVAYDALDRCRAHRGPEGENFFQSLSMASIVMSESVKPVPKAELKKVLVELDGLRRDREASHEREPKRKS